MDRIKRLSFEVLGDHKSKFGEDFAANKKVLDQLSIIRSKGLKNKIAGYITKFIKKEIHNEKIKQAQAAAAEQEAQLEIAELARLKKTPADEEAAPAETPDAEASPAEAPAVEAVPVETPAAETAEAAPAETSPEEAPQPETAPVETPAAETATEPAAPAEAAPSETDAAEKTE